MHRALALLLLATMTLLSTGCIMKMRRLEDENMMLRERALQHQQDMQAMEVRFLEARRELDALRAERTEQERQIAALKERSAIMQRTMTDSQRAQADALMKDLEDRIQRENELRLQIDDLSARVETLANDRMLLESQLEKAEAEIADLRGALAETTTKLEEFTQQFERVRVERDEARAERDDFRRQLQGLQASKEDVATELEKVSSELRDREKELATAQRELETAQSTFNTAQEAARASAGQADVLNAALREGLRDAGPGLQLREGPTPTVVVLSDDLYEPSTVLLSAQGRALLDRIATAIGDKEFSLIRVEGHTDNTPVRNMPFVDNWDLAAARAATVTRHLARQSNLPARKLSAASYAFFSPAATNDTAEGRRQNRRVEIVIIP